MRIWWIGFLCLGLASCNSVYLKPGSLDTTHKIYAHRGGYSMTRSIKVAMEQRGYKINTGKLKYVTEIAEKEIFEIPNNVKYAVNVEERTEILRPIWCMFNGFWWWNFNVSIINRTTNEEIMSWRGRGCQNSSLRKLNNILDELEMKPEDKPTSKKRKSKPQTCEVPGLIITVEKES